MRAKSPLLLLDVIRSFYKINRYAIIDIQKLHTVQIRIFLDLFGSETSPLGVTIK